GTVKPLEPGNIQWYGRDKVPMGKGGYGTVYSFSREEDGKEVLVPQIYDGKLHSQEEAWQHYKQTGQHMGKFKNASDADYFGQKYHEDAAAGKYDKAISAMPQGDTIRIRLNGKTGTIPKKRLQFYLDQGAFVLPDQKPPTPKNVGAPTSPTTAEKFKAGAKTFGRETVLGGAGKLGIADTEHPISDSLKSLIAPKKMDADLLS